MSDRTERSLAKCRKFDFAIEDHGLPVLVGSFEYDDSSAQGLGYMVNVAFIMRFLAAVGVDSLRALDGKSCWVTHTNGHIVKIEPLHKKDGTPFIIADWQEWTKANCSHSASEQLTGKKRP